MFKLHKLNPIFSAIAAFATSATLIGGLYAYFAKIAVTTDRVELLYKEVVSPDDSRRSVSVQLATISKDISTMNSQDTGIPHIRRRADENREDIIVIRGSLETNFPKIVVDEFEERLEIQEQENIRLSEQLTELQKELDLFKRNLASIQGYLSSTRGQIEKGISEEDMKILLEEFSAQLREMENLLP
jgi:uncharacterized coiled-coil protein SlyX